MFLPIQIYLKLFSSEGESMFKIIVEKNKAEFLKDCSKTPALQLDDCLFTMVSLGSHPRAPSSASLGFSPLISPPM